MAVDVQGLEMAKPWLEKAGASFAALVDREAKLAAQFGLKYVPFSVLIDETGRIVRGPLPVNVGDEAQRAGIAAWIERGDAALNDLENAKVSAGHGFADAEAELRFCLAAQLLRLGRIRDATLQLKRALGRDPDNWIIRKQIWAIRHPERFYSGAIDFRWQREQLKAERELMVGGGRQ